jgi:hypothetical protein
VGAWASYLRSSPVKTPPPKSPTAATTAIHGLIPLLLPPPPLVVAVASAAAPAAVALETGGSVEGPAPPVTPFPAAVSGQDIAAADVDLGSVWAASEDEAAAAGMAAVSVGLEEAGGVGAGGYGGEMGEAVPATDVVWTGDGDIGRGAALVVEGRVVGVFDLVVSARVVEVVSRVVWAFVVVAALVGMGLVVAGRV